MKKHFEKKKGEENITNIDLFISGSIAGLANTIVITPMEHIRIKVSKAKPHPLEKYTGSGNACKRIF